MLRIITLMGFGLLLISNLCAQMGSAPRPYMGLFGLIHTVREEGYNCTGDPAEKPWRVSEVTYDRQGNETFRAFYNADGSVGNQVSTTFDKNGTVTGWTSFSGKSDSAPDGVRYHSDITFSGGKVVSSIGYKEDTPIVRSTYQYDERGNKIRETIIEIGCCTTTRTFKYDALNRVIENTYDAYGLSSLERRTYDAAGNVVEETTYDKGVLAFTTTREFKAGQLVKETRTSRDGGVRTTINTYNKAGDLVLTTIDDPSITSKTTVEYYDNGKIRSTDQLTVAKVGGMRQDSEASPSPGRILQKYDINGNQVERYIYDDKGSLYLTQLSSYDDRGRQIRLIETSASNHMYDRDLVYEYDSHRNRITSLCRKVTDAGEVKLIPLEKKIITYFDN